MDYVFAGDTDITTYFHLRLAADGTDATGLTITNIDLQYVRCGVAPAAKVDATALAATDSAHADNKAIEVDATDQPGVYRVDWPDAAFAAGVRGVALTVKCATAFTETLWMPILSATRGLAGTALPAAAADAAGGLIISDAGGLDADAQLVTKINDILTDTGTTLQAEVDGIQADTEDIQARLPAALVSGRIDASVGAMAANVMTAAAAAADLSQEFADTLLSRDASTHTTNSTLGAIVNDWEDAGRLDAILDARASQTSVDTIDDFLDTEIAAILAAVDTEIAAIKAKTDAMTYTATNFLQVDLQYVNAVQLNGDGAATPWGP